MIKILNPQLAACGRIKIGVLSNRKTKSGTNLPQKIDHFLICEMDRDDEDEAKNFRVNAAAMEALKPFADHDGKVRTIPIVVHSDDLDLVFRNNLELYSGKRLACQGDGDRATRWKFDGQKRTNQTSEVSCICKYHPDHPNYQPGKLICKPHALLSCSLDLPGFGVSGSVWQWRTTSVVSIERMLGSLIQIQNLTGTIRGLPLLLCLSTINTSNGDIHVCHVELRESIVEARRGLMLEARARSELRAMMGVKPELALPPVTEQDEADIVTEFLPDLSAVEVMDEKQATKQLGPEHVLAKLGE